MLKTYDPVSNLALHLTSVELRAVAPHAIMYIFSVVFGFKTKLKDSFKSSVFLRQSQKNSLLLLPEISKVRK
jgi:hypothetical protein